MVMIWMTITTVSVDRSTFIFKQFTFDHVMYAGQSLRIQTTHWYTGDQVPGKFTADKKNISLTYQLVVPTSSCLVCNSSVGLSQFRNFTQMILTLNELDHKP